MSMLLTADWHLTDIPSDAYRWLVFDELKRIYKTRPYKQLFILGDLSDRKDRHSSILVNRLAAEMQALLKLYPDLELFVIIGNHDMPMQGPPFWEFLNYMHVRVITAPFAADRLLLLPYAANPASAWEGIPLSRYRAAFMHQTVTGVVSQNGQILKNDKMPSWPRGMKVYSGDIHVPQIIGQVTYIGAPHPIDFGDKYPCRMLRLDEDYKIVEEIKLRGIAKRMITVESLEELQAISTFRGDQARVRFKLPLEDAETWNATQDAISQWAQQRGVSIASTEAEIIASVHQAEVAEDIDPLVTKPEEVLRLFAEAEEIGGSMLDSGLAFLEEARG